MAEKQSRRSPSSAPARWVRGWRRRSPATGSRRALFDVKAEQLEKAKGTVDFVYTTLTNGGFMTAEDADAGRGRITYTSDLAEALARRRLRRRDGARSRRRSSSRSSRRSRRWSATTSSWPPTPQASRSPSWPRSRAYPGRVVGMHWSNPPHLIPVIEVIRGEQTTDETAQRDGRRWSRRSAWCRRWSTATCRASSRTASSTRSCARRCISSTRASPAPKRSTPSPSGASATSWPSSARSNCSTWPVSTSTPASPAT